MTLYSELVLILAKAPFQVLARLNDGNGLEGMWQVMNLLEPRTAITKRDHLNHILNCHPAKKADKVEVILVKVDGHMNQCEAVSGRPLAEDTSVIVLISVCVHGLRERLDAGNKETSY